MKILNKKAVNELRKFYPAGAAVELIHMDDPQAPAPGTRGIISHVDDAGSIHVSWETGSTLALVPGEDQFRIIQI